MRAAFLFSLTLFGGYSSDLCAESEGAEPQSAKTLQVAYFHFPPFLIAGEEPTGTIIDIHKEIYEKAGYTLNFVEFPYARALMVTASGDVDFCASLVPNAVKGLKYPALEVAQLKQVFVVRRNDSWRYNGIDSLRNKKLGNITYYDYSSISEEYNNYLDSGGSDIYTLSGDRATLRILNMIKLGRLDVFNESKSLIEYLVFQNGMENEFAYAGILGEPLLTKPGFPEDGVHSNLLVEVFEKGMRELRRTGKLKEIMSRYGLRVW